MTDSLSLPNDDLAVLVHRDRQDLTGRAARSFIEDRFGRQAQDERAPEAEAAPGGQPSLARRAARDIAGGIGEAGTQIIGGARDALHGALTGVAAFDEWASDGLGLPKLQILNEQGAFDIRLLSAEEGEQAEVSLPEIREPETVTGGLVRGVSQFLTGFAAGSRALGTLGGLSTRAAVARSSAASAMSDFAAFDAHEERLSDLVQEFPALENPVTEYLASDMDDGELEGRLKNVAEGALSDVLLTGLVTAVRGVRLARKARGDGETYAQAADRLARDGRLGEKVVPDMSGVRATDAPMIFRPDDANLEQDTRTYLETLTAQGEGLADAVPPGDAARALTLGKVETGSGDVYVNWSRIETAEDVKAVIQQMADADKAGVAEATRGVRTNVETALSADKENAWALLAERRGGEPMNAEQTLAMRRLWASSGEKLTAAAKLVREAPTAENVFMFRRAMALHGAIQQQVLAVRTETARALQQWTIPAGPNEAVARQIEDTVAQFGGSDVSEDLAARIIAMAEDGNFGAVDNLTRKSVGAATLDAVHEYWINALLSGPKTHLVNVASNASVIMLAQIERMVAAKVGAFRGTVDGVDAAEAGAMMHGAVASLPDAWRYAKEAFKTGSSRHGIQKVELLRQRAISTESLTNTRSNTFNRAMNLPVLAQGINAFGAVVNLPVRALGAGDEFFKTISSRMEIHAQAARQAAREGRDQGWTHDQVQRRMVELVDDPSEETLAMAREFAQYNTFTNNPGPVVGAIQSLKSQVPFMRYLTPFLNTPANILRFAVERSPAAPLLPDMRADIRAGGRRADLAVARMGLGSFAMLTAYDAAMNGQVTGSGPTNWRERQNLQRMGWQPYSIKAGDRYFAYNRLDPIGALLGVSANMAELSLNADTDPGDEWDEAAYRTIGAVGQQMMDKTYLRGLSDFFGVMSDPQREAPGYFERFVGSFSPTLFREVEGIVDPELRRAHDTITTIKSRLPGFSEDLPLRHDLWGREMSYQSGLGAGYDAVSPIYSRREEAEPIDREFQNIRYFPSPPSRVISNEGERFNLGNDPAVYEEYMVLQGGTAASKLPIKYNKNGQPSAVSKRMMSYGDRTLLETLNAIVTGQHPISEDYAAADDYGKADIVKRTIGDFRDRAREVLIERYPDVFAPGTGQR